MPSLNVISLLAFNASPLNSVSFNFLLWRRSFQQVSMDIRYLVLIKTGKKKRKPWKCLLCSTHMWVVESVYNLLPFFDRHRSIKTNILVPMQRKKNHIVWKLICNYSLEYLFLFVLCTLFVLLIDIYNKQTNNEKSKNDRDLALFRMLCEIRFQYFYYFFFSFSVFGNLILNTLKNKKK